MHGKHAVTSEILLIVSLNLLKSYNNMDTSQTRSGPNRPAAGIGGDDFLRNGSKFVIHDSLFMTRDFLADLNLLLVVVRRLRTSSSSFWRILR